MSPEIPDELREKAEALMDKIEACRCDECSRIVFAFALAVRNEAIAEEREAAAKIAQDNADEFERLLAEGKGEHCKPGYVRDAVWHAWGGKASASASIAAAIRARSSK